MAKSLCKFSRRDIKAGKIDKLVLDSQFYCGSCARTSNQKGALCKPVSLAKLSQSNQLDKKVTQALLPIQASNVPEVIAKAKAMKAQREYNQQATIKPLNNGVNLVVPSKVIAKPSIEPTMPELEAQPLLAPNEIKQQLQTLKKGLKAQKKQQKQRKKLLKKQRKLAKKHQKVLKRELKLNKQEAKIAKQEARIEKRLSSFNTVEAIQFPKNITGKVVGLKSLH